MKLTREHARTSLRLSRLDAMIRERRCRSAAQAARELEVSARTIMRDLDLLRDQFGAKLRYDRRRGGWFYEEPFYGLHTVTLSEGEMVAIFLAERVLAQYRGLPFERTLRCAFDKIVSALPAHVTIDLNAFDEAFSFETGPVSEVDADTFAALAQAAQSRTSVEVIYYTQSRGRLTQRMLDPYHIHNHRGEWYLIAYDHRRRQVRVFHLGRIRSLQSTDRKFTLEEDFDIEAYLRTCFAMVRGARSYIVEIEFDEYQARWIRERQKWHASEEREELPDGKLLLRMKLGGLDAVRRFVLQYGAHARVLRPARLRRMIEEEIGRLARLYDIENGLTPAKDRRKAVPHPSFAQQGDEGETAHGGSDGKRREARESVGRNRRTQRAG